MPAQDTPASTPTADGLSPGDEAAGLAAPEQPAPDGPPDASGEPSVGKLLWLIGAVVVLAVVYFIVR